MTSLPDGFTAWKPGDPTPKFPDMVQAAYVTEAGGLHIDIAQADMIKWSEACIGYRVVETPAFLRHSGDVRR